MLYSWGGPLAEVGSSAKYEHTSKFTLASQRSFRITYERPIMGGSSTFLDLLFNSSYFKKKQFGGELTSSPITTIMSTDNMTPAAFPPGFFKRQCASPSVSLRQCMCPCARISINTNV